MIDDSESVLEFLGPQQRAYGGNVEIAPGLWALFAVPAGDPDANALAGSLLAGAPFPYECGASEDDRWALYYVDSANRAAAIHWLDDAARRAAGEFREPSPEQRALLDELTTSATPHRVAQRLGEKHARGDIDAGIIRTPAGVRSLLDRLHMREPLFFAALHTLLSQHLIDMLVLLRQLIPEDVSLTNEIVKGSLSRDPFLQSRQDSAAEIRNILLQFRIINALDQQKNIALANPYAAYLEIVSQGDEVIAAIDGTIVPLPRPAFLDAIRAIRRNLYRGANFAEFDTQAPWMTAQIAHPFRYIRQRLESHRELTPLDGLYMLERAVAE